MATNNGDDDFLDAIVAAAQRVADVSHDLQSAVDAAREAGYSWRQIGAALGVSKQAAQRRFRKD